MAAIANLEPWFFKYNSWSYSKHRLWDLCKRHYYYQHIGPALKESENVDVSRLKRLKKLTSKYALEGLFIHEAIENQIGQHYLGRGMNEQGAKAQFSNRVEQYRRTACEMITEFFNGMPEDDTFFDSIRDNGLNKIGIFFSVIWPQMMDLDYLQHENFDKFKINDVEVIVKVDYVSKTKNDIIVITDWKTGEDREDYESDLQIGIYVLWAMHHYQKDACDIRSELAHLKTGMMRPYEFSYDALEQIKTTILRDYDNMNKSYEIIDYPPSPEPRKCMSCQFGRICPESKIKESLVCHR